MLDLDGTDRFFVGQSTVYIEVHNERSRAHRKHYPHSRELTHWRDTEWLPILMEEVGEVAHELTYDVGLTGQRERLRAELIQVAAMACAWIDAIDEVDGRSRQ